MSGPEALAGRSAAAVTLASCPADVVELAAFRDRAAELERLAAAQELRLAAPGCVATCAARLSLNVRPGRWLVLSPPAIPGASAERWQAACGDRAAAVDLSAALTAFFLSGPALGEMLARACRLDLDVHAFPTGRAAATMMVQVPAILARLTPGMLLLTPATTAQHLREWLVTASRPFGLALAGTVAVPELCGDGSL